MLWRSVLLSFGPVKLLIRNGDVHSYTSHGSRTLRTALGDQDSLPQRGVEGTTSDPFGSDALESRKGLWKLVSL